MVQRHVGHGDFYATGKRRKEKQTEKKKKLSMLPSMRWISTSFLHPHVVATATANTHHQGPITKGEQEKRNWKRRCTVAG